MEKWFQFTAWNTQTIYGGYGTEEEANTYCDLLNRDKEINFYQVKSIPDDECKKLDSGQDIESFRIDLAIDTLREEIEWRSKQPF